MENTKYKVLLVEDNEIERISFERFVENNDIPYDYVIAKCVSDAQRELACKKFDIVISDHDLGDGTAIDVLEFAKDTPVIVVTGAGDEETAINTWKAGAYDYLVKDIDQNYLKAIPITVENTIKHKETEDKLQLLSGAIRSTEDSVFITNMKGEIIFVNKAFCKTYGYREEEIIGKNNSILWIGKNQSGNTRSVFQTRLAGGGWEVGFYHKRKDESIFPVSLSRSTIKDANRKDIAIVGVARDISERLLIEDELRSTAMKLQKRIQTQNQIAISSAQSIQRLLNEGRIDKASKVLGDFLDISKINTGSMELNHTNFNFFELASNVKESLSRLAGQKDIELVLRDKMQDAEQNAQYEIIADYDRMEQVLVNLLLYAISFSPQNENIDIVLKNIGNDYAVEIHSSGCDFNKYKIHKIANNPEWIMQQLEEGREDIALGLRVAKEIIEIHGGQMWTEKSNQMDNAICFRIPKSGVLNENSFSEQNVLETLNSKN